MFGLGVSELIAIAVIILIIMVLGTKKLPEIGKGLGGAVRELKNIENELTGTGSKTEDSKRPMAETSEGKPSMESMVARKILGQFPGVKKVMNVKDKINKVKEIIK
jgi:sec-independent protein translocase protein TatA